jgi:hypothetical protein
VTEALATKAAEAAFVNIHGNISLLADLFETMSSANL